MTKLFLIPTTLSNTICESVLLEPQLKLIHHLTCFIVETAKIGRAHIKQLKLSMALQNLSIHELNKHNTDYKELFQPLLDGNDVGLLSDCGVPAIADPGSHIVSLAHKFDIEVVPLIGPSSILLALMSSGVNGQSFSFHGYLPLNLQEKITKIQLMQFEIIHNKQTQIFIETPYRNQVLLNLLIKILDSRIVLSTAINLMYYNQKIISKTIEQWKNIPLPDLNKCEVVYTIGIY